MLQLLLPGSASAGTHAGTTCVSDAALSSCDAGGRLPSDVTLSCVFESGQVAFEWTAGVAGIPAGSYTTTIFVSNAAATVQYSQFVFQTWQDSSKVAQIDALAAFPSPASTRELFQVELVSQYMSSTFTAHAAANTSVVFAFELAEDLAASFSIYITAPCDVEFPTLCEASVGPDVLGSTLPAQVTKYISFLDAMSVACTGLRKKATLLVTPTESMSTFPALPGFLYVFRVNVTVPSVTADVNTWRLLVTDRTSRQETGIVGDDLSDLKTSVTPANSAASDMRNVTVSFLGRSSIPAQTEVATNNSDSGILRIEMPEGFTVPTSTSAFCLYWSGLYEVGLSAAVAVSNVHVVAV